jgi:myo-inositol-1-phosphate synthase
MNEMELDGAVLVTFLVVCKISTVNLLLLNMGGNTDGKCLSGTSVSTMA